MIPRHGRPLLTDGVIGYYRASDRLRYGWEQFQLIDHADGSRTVRALCHIDAGPIRPRAVTRTVAYGVDAEHRPRHCSIGLQRDGAFLGTGLFFFDDYGASCESLSAVFGRRSQHIATSGRIPTFGAHNLTCDIAHLRLFDHSRSDRVQPVRGAMLASAEHDGCSGPELVGVDFAIEYVGREEVVVPAGTFEADRYRFLLEGTLPEEHPTEELWCLPDTYDFIRIRVGGYMDSTFELEALAQPGPGTAQADE